ncbi:MAG: Mbov_0396 family ICE element transmembrane protein [Ruminiclostridium sp.]
MPISILSLFSKIYNAILNAIFKPIAEWLSGIISSIFKFIINDVIQPILEPVFKTVMDYVGYYILDWFFQGLYAILQIFLYIIDVMQTAFDVLIGMQPITFRGADGVTRTDTLVNALILDDGIRNVLIAVSLVAFGLALLFAIYATIRSTLDFDFENKRPIGQVLRSVLKTMINFLIVPFTMLVMLYLSSAILTTISNALSQGSDMSLGRTILAVSSMSKDGVIDSSPSEASLSVQPWADLAAGKITYSKWPDYYHISKIDYAVGFISSIFIIIIEGMCLLNFIRRIFDIILLYITSPYFVSTMVLDDGEKFAKWRSTFIAKVFSGYGSAIGMRLYLMIVPMIMSDKISFFTDNAVGHLGDYLIKLIFIMGGAWAVYKSSSMLTTILDQGVGYDEQMTNMAAMGMMSRAFHTTKGYAVKGLSRLKKGKGGGSAGSDKAGAEGAGAGGKLEKSNKFSTGAPTAKEKFNGGEKTRSSAEEKLAHTPLTPGEKMDRDKVLGKAAGVETDKEKTGSNAFAANESPNDKGGAHEKGNAHDKGSAHDKSNAFDKGAKPDSGGDFTQYCTSTFSDNAQDNLNMFDLSEGMASFGTTDKQANIPEGFTFVPDFVPKDRKAAEYNKMRALNKNFAPLINMMEHTKENGFYYKSKNGKAKVGLMNAAGFNFEVPKNMAMIPRMMTVDQAKKFCAEKSKGSDFMANYYKRMGAQLDGKQGLGTKKMADSFNTLRRTRAKGVHLTPSADGKTLESVRIFDGSQLYTRSRGETEKGSAAAEMVNEMGFTGAENFSSPPPLQITYPHSDKEDDSSAFTSEAQSSSSGGFTQSTSGSNNTSGAEVIPVASASRADRANASSAFTTDNQKVGIGGVSSNVSGAANVTADATRDYSKMRATGGGIPRKITTTGNIPRNKISRNRNYNGSSNARNKMNSSSAFNSEAQSGGKGGYTAANRSFAKTSTPTPPPTSNYSSNARQQSNTYTSGNTTASTPTPPPTSNYSSNARAQSNTYTSGSTGSSSGNNSAPPPPPKPTSRRNSRRDGNSQFKDN